MRAGNCVCQEHSFVIAPRNDSGGVLVFEGKWVTMERERNGLLWSESIMGYYGACMMGYYGLMVYGSGNLACNVTYFGVCLLL